MSEPKMMSFPSRGCGAEMFFPEGSDIVECEYCALRQSVPETNANDRFNQRKLNRLKTAEQLRSEARFDEAIAMYDDIAADFPEADVYWGQVLCKYGIVYVKDPGTGSYKPTCYRVSPNSILEDENFKDALETADAKRRDAYLTEAEKLETIRRKILEIAAKEKKYDVFICYKATDEANRPTPDGADARQIYQYLTQKGYRVFFSEITLLGKLGVEYEPYIYSALMTSRVMLAVACRPDYYEAPWVRNEWSRYLDQIRHGDKKTLIPCYRGMTPASFPEEFEGCEGISLSGTDNALEAILERVVRLAGKREEQEDAICGGRQDPRVRCG